MVLHRTLKDRLFRKIKHLIYDIEILFRFKYPGMFYKKNNIFEFTEILREFITGWKRELIWCPSQLNKTIMYKNTEYCLYARWRWDDPWSGYIVIRKDNGINIEQLWSEELLHKFDYKDYDIRKVERTLDKIFRDTIIHRKSNLSFK